MPQPGLWHPEPLLLQQYIADPYLYRRCSNIVLSQSLWVSGSQCAQGLFEHSGHLWWVSTLILNMISRLLQSFWGFSFALICGVSPQSHFSTTQLPLQHHAASIPAPAVFWSSLTLDMGYKVYTVRKKKKKRLGADCGLYHELLSAKFRLEQKKVGKTTISIRYDLNQIPYVYTVDIANRFKRLDLIGRVHEELWKEISIVQKAVIKIISKKKEMQKGKTVV